MVVANSCDNIPMLQLGTLEFDCPSVMGVLNVTPDSFSDGGRFVARDASLREEDSISVAGDAILDIGGDSSRPRSGSVNAQEALDR
ncbi:MAG: dihydropteroate synthase, partial [Acidobacteria bacterium]|nr:dihydropteroate synthase [Acidobacteriota bacterium]